MIKRIDLNRPGGTGPVADQLLNLVVFLKKFKKIVNFLKSKVFTLIRRHLLTGKWRQIVTVAFNRRTLDSDTRFGYYYSARGSRVEVSAPVLFFFNFSLCRGLMRTRHGVPEIEKNDDLSFSAMAHSDKQISQQMSTIVFSNALVETLSIKLADSFIHVL